MYDRHELHHMFPTIGILLEIICNLNIIWDIHIPVKWWQ